MQPTYIEPGHTGIIEVAYSEVAMYMRVAGRRMAFHVTAGPYPMCQLLQSDGRPFSGPITLGEAGVYRDSDGKLYFYPPLDYLPNLSEFESHKLGFYDPDAGRYVITSTHTTEGCARRALLAEGGRTCGHS